MAKKTDLDLPNRMVAALLAAAWIGAGMVAIGLGLAGRRWLILLPGIFGVGYGLLWVRVCVEGRRLPWPAGRLRRRRRRR